MIVVERSLVAEFMSVVSPIEIGVAAFDAALESVVVIASLSRLDGGG